MDPLNYEGRERRVLEELKARKRVLDKGIVERFIRAKQALTLGVMADSLGGLFGADSVTDDTMKRGDEYESALSALEREAGIA